MQPEEKDLKNAQIEAENDNNEDIEPRVYELGYHIVSSISEEGIPGEVGVIKGILEKHKAQVISEEFPRLRNLAYVIQKGFGGKYQKYNSAYFGWVKFDADPAVLDVLKADLDKNDKILRYIIIKTVRESTMATIRPQMPRKEESKILKPVKKEEVKKPVSEAELDKTIEELIVE